ncbi:aldose 1-epimerase (macronuclear) [Tetrahymena thermophila SB210]|uniref:Aldose 1-epimerase n=1 Tax=Tetrahymena thermophila (strain SB210) TaxID=312017 RepID=I7MGQ4_TETTS|nr:aldose 1-epimerase [Tetrahymena thermophila SB210]EAS01822.1 aldose 1-epimerase [Tetrahymena thermophila SB210]|eukprot:XP_001022067.1 aldose 1-epimerase [Tetrahymena thermophila SB210]
MQIEQTLFGKIGEESIWKFTFSNKKGTKVSVINYGAIITEIQTLDKQNQLANIVLNFDDFTQYHLHNDAYFGAFVGRCANRIANGKFSLSNDPNHVYQLAVNNGPNHLHGGIKGFDKKIYQFQIQQPNQLILTGVSEDGEEGYPGKLEIQIKYELNDENEFQMIFTSQTDKQTLCNLTSHSYFNLQTKKDFATCMQDHSLFINADFYTPLDDTCCPYGEILKVQNTPFDFTQQKTLQEQLSQQGKDNQLQIGNGLDHNFILKRSGKINLAAKVQEKASGRVLEVYTNQPGLQLYTGNYLSQIKGFVDRAGFCLETQGIPNSINIPHFPQVELLPGQTHEHITLYKFSTI